MRSYGITPWGTAFLRAFSPADARRAAKARAYFRDRHVHALTVVPGRITSSVSGSQLDPFDVTIDLRTVDAATVVGLLQRDGRAAELTEVTRGGQPAGVGELVAPTEAADAKAGCTCPVDDLCIHVLATAYEVAAMVDRDPAVLLDVMGAPLTDLLALANATETPVEWSARNERSVARPGAELIETDFYGDQTALPEAPLLPDFYALTEFDAKLLRAALRATGVIPGDVAEAADGLAALYDRITGLP
ncbi:MULTISPECIES: hypothetical protein [unclassified Gordonia (in: high G+C Gram-positive bacteria)]|uniref:hypothetical protein n=1 Tax=unclassified Gordonia (in: high G+C Gram-positive bacteria) TaxID=2657482 RepID=UPI002D1FAA3E|nr:hypothetical protein [Gordonia sp. (in: high G+C Gram-positive bacteria)]